MCFVWHFARLLALAGCSSSDESDPPPQPDPAQIRLLDGGATFEARLDMRRAVPWCHNGLLATLPYEFPFFRKQSRIASGSPFLE